MKKFVLLLLTLLFSLMLAAPAGAVEYNIVEGTPDHDWTFGVHAHDPMCDEPIPCRTSLSQQNGFTTSKPDKIYAKSGWDWGSSGAGTDILIGATGMEHFYGGPDDDTLLGQWGHDHLYGDDGNDFIDTSDGNDEEGNIEEVFGGEGNDKCIVDEDTNEGITISPNCDVVVVEDIGMPGKSRVFGSHFAFHKDDSYRTVTPGTYNNWPRG